MQGHYQYKTSQPEVPDRRETRADRFGRISGSPTQHKSADRRRIGNKTAQSLGDMEKTQTVLEEKRSFEAQKAPNIRSTDQLKGYVWAGIGRAKRFRTREIERFPAQGTQADPWPGDNVRGQEQHQHEGSGGSKQGDERRHTQT